MTEPPMSLICHHSSQRAAKDVTLLGGDQKSKGRRSHILRNIYYVHFATISPALMWAEGVSV